jgi:hypothetical protein
LQSICRKFWWLLASYCALVLVVLYGFSVFSLSETGELQDGLIYVGTRCGFAQTAWQNLD